MCDGERPGGPGQDQRGRAAQRAGLTDQHLQVMIQKQRFAAPHRCPFMDRDLPATIEQQQLRGPQHPADLMADQAGRNRVVALPDTDPRVPIDPRTYRQPRLKRLGRQRPQQAGFEREVLPDVAGAVADPAGVVSKVVAGQQAVELGQRVDFGDRDQVVAPEPAALTLHAALLMRPLDTGMAVKRLEAMMGTKRHPTPRLGAVAAEQHPRHRSYEVVVTDVEHRRPAEHLESSLVAFQERLLPLGCVGPMDSLAGERQPHGEQENLGADPRQVDPQIREVDLALGARLMGLRDERVLRPLAGRRPDLRPAFRDVVPHRRIGQIGQLMLIHEPRQDPAGGVTLLARRGQILSQHRVDQNLRRIQLRSRPHRRLPLRRHRI